ncbi:MAG TPA: hypothetical protein ENN80_03840 [Candidatus Hydrogenedentes bacterium]|nr:hypothetical protein [Candidatus Hydrogenedentota bacterium]
MPPFPAHDLSVLRGLAEEKARIAALPVQQERALMWTRLNDLDPVKPMVWINEIPWHEFPLERQLECSDPFCRDLEYELRRTLYQWKHMPGDMVVEGCMCSPLVICENGFGIDAIGATVATCKQSVLARSFEPQIKNEADVERIHAPEVWLDSEATERSFEQMHTLFDGVIPVRKRGIPGFWFAPWDQLVTWWGVQQSMIDLLMRPDLVKYAMDRLLDAHLERLDRIEALNALARNDDNTRVGSGGYGYTNELPQPDCNPAHVRPLDVWGAATAQIFSEVSPDMHREFALEYEVRWLERFGLNYYGCCEPLDTKIDILAHVPRLRKISMSPWINPERAAENMGRKYVFSFKPNPAILAESSWDPERARAQLRHVLDAARSCIVEVIMKDISTVAFEPKRLHQWADIAAQLTADYAHG